MKHGIMHHDSLLGGAMFEAEGHRWSWILGLGLVFLLLGAVTLGVLLGTTIVSIYFLGLLLLGGGVAQALQAFSLHGMNSTGTHLLMSVLYFILGALVLENPLGTSLALTTLLAATLVVLGLVRALAALNHRAYRGWGWLLASGLITLVLGFLVLLQWVGAGFWIIGMFVGIDLVFHGAAYVRLGLAVKPARR